MQLWELFVIAVGLSMDAFAVSICKGLSVQRLRWSHALTAGAWFGAFQALMPLAGWLLGTRFEGIITSVDHWVAFVLLVLIGGNMVKESRGACEALDASFAVRAMLPLAVATSIDALAVGVTFAFLGVDILPAVCFIGCTILGGGGSFQLCFWDGTAYCGGESDSFSGWFVSQRLCHEPHESGKWWTAFLCPCHLVHCSGGDGRLSNILSCCFRRNYCLA